MLKLSDDCIGFMHSTGVYDGNVHNKYLKEQVPWRSLMQVFLPDSGLFSH